MGGVVKSCGRCWLRRGHGELLAEFQDDVIVAFAAIVDEPCNAGMDDVHERVTVEIRINPRPLHASPHQLELNAAIVRGVVTPTSCPYHRLSGDALVAGNDLEALDGTLAKGGQSLARALELSHWSYSLNVNLRLMLL